jgi:hypothetical protein
LALTSEVVFRNAEIRLSLHESQRLLGAKANSLALRIAKPLDDAIRV